MEKEVMYEKLWQLADDKCSPAERLQLRSLIEQDEEWRRAWAEIELINTTLANMPVTEPSAGFATNVMAQLKRPTLQSTESISLLSNRAKWSLVAGFGVFMTLAATSGRGESMYFSNLMLSQWWDGAAYWSRLTSHLPTTSTVLILLALVSVFSFDQLIVRYRETRSLLIDKRN